MDIEKVMFPESGKLIIEETEISAVILDGELDPVKCEFFNDGCVTLDAKGYEYLTLSRENLEQLIELLDESELKFKQIFK